MNIQIKQVQIYEPEACDCCEGYWETQFVLNIEGVFVMMTDSLTEILQYISDQIAVIDYMEENDD